VRQGISLGPGINVGPRKFRKNVGHEKFGKNNKCMALTKQTNPTKRKVQTYVAKTNKQTIKQTNKQTNKKLENIRRFWKKFQN
jgi:hypothetical protein